MAEDFDIDNIIPKDEQTKQASNKLEPNDSMKSFDLSIKNYDIESNIDSSSKRGGGILKT